MAKIEKISIALPSDMLAGLRAAVESGGYASTSEVIRDALRDWALRRKIETLDVDALRKLVEVGIDSGPGIDADVVFSRLRAKYASMQSRVDA